MRFQISRVKGGKDDAVVGPKPTDYDSIAMAVAKVILFYMASDTIRKCLVHTIATKIN